MSAYLYIIDDDGNTYNFPPDFFITKMGWRKTSNIRNIPFAHGGRDTGDGYIEARTILIEGALRDDTLAGLETKVRSFSKAMYAGGKLYVSDETVTRYIRVGSAVVDADFMSDYRHEKRANVTFVAEYPFWQDHTATTDVNVLAGDDDFTVDNSGSDVVTLPVVTIAADQSADVPSVKLQNVSDGGMIFEYQNANFKQGDTLEIDSYNGTVKRNGNDELAYVTQARFPRLQNLVNTIFFEGAACTVTYTFRKVYL